MNEKTMHRYLLSSSTNWKIWKLIDVKGAAAAVKKYNICGNLLHIPLVIHQFFRVDLIHTPSAENRKKRNFVRMKNRNVEMTIIEQSQGDESSITEMSMVVSVYPFIR